MNIKLKFRFYFKTNILLFFLCVYFGLPVCERASLLKIDKFVVLFNHIFFVQSSDQKMR